ncbi:unnamed protein product [Medioppia subpectinata]|uniref:Uncharacterized protein n=1 Tax=Medioppia subpectinata TaxID=1979941 RepID=A0A7R9LGW3_9ACAR|nr:unnamed protein product [Medioppia subpectinata]CAG2118124.1 unnamed protein product [Medioppia subpectinata]
MKKYNKTRLKTRRYHSNRQKRIKHWARIVYYRLNVHNLCI